MAIRAGVFVLFFFLAGWVWSEDSASAGSLAPSTTFAVPAPAFKLTGYWTLTSDLANLYNQTGVGQGTPENSTAGSFSIAGFSLDSNGTGVDMTYTNGTWNTGLTPFYFGDYDIHLSFFDQMVYTGVGVYDSSDFRITDTYTNAHIPLAGFNLGDDSYKNSLFGTEIKVRPVQGLTLGAYFPVAKGDVLGTPYGTNVTTSTAYSWTMAGASYKMPGFGTFFGGFSGYYKQAYLNFDFKGWPALTAQVGVDYDYQAGVPVWGSVFGYAWGPWSFYTQDQFCLGNDGTNYTVTYGNTPGSKAVYGDSFGYFVALEASFHLNNMVFFKVDSDWNNAYDPVYNNNRVYINSKTRVADPYWNLFPDVVFHNDQWIGPCDLQVGFRESFDLLTGKNFWVIPLTVSILVK